MCFGFTHGFIPKQAKLQPIKRFQVKYYRIAEPDKIIATEITAKDEWSALRLAQYALQLPFFSIVEVKEIKRG